MVSNDDLWGALSSDKNSGKNEKSLDEILKSDESGESQGTALKSSAGKNKLVLAGAATAAVVAIGGLFLVSPFSGAGLFGSDKGANVQQVPKLQDAAQASAAPTEVAPPWYTLPENTLPVDAPEWSKELGSFDATNISADQKKWVADTVGDTRLGAQSALTLPSEDQGYTSDPGKATDANGLPNPDFSYWTSGLFNEQSTLMTNKLLNPIYGGWAQYQYSTANARSSFDINVMGDIFTPSYAKTLSKNKAATPIYADWNANDYGMGSQLLSSGGARWVGEITDADVSFSYDQANLSYKAEGTYQVKFTSWTKDQKKVTKNGTLKLSFVADNGAVQNNKAFRVLINGGSLSVK